MADALGRKPDEVGWPDNVDIGDFGSDLHLLQDPIVFGAVKD